jgi:hypothetical protein
MVAFSTRRTSHFLPGLVMLVVVVSIGGTAQAPSLATHMGWRLLCRPRRHGAATCHPQWLRSRELWPSLRACQMPQHTARCARSSGSRAVTANDRWRQAALSLVRCRSAAAVSQRRASQRFSVRAGDMLGWFSSTTPPSSFRVSIVDGAILRDSSNVYPYIGAQIGFCRPDGFNLGEVKTGSASLGCAGDRQSRASRVRAGRQICSSSRWVPLSDPVPGIK